MNSIYIAQHTLEIATQLHNHSLLSPASCEDSTVDSLLGRDFGAIAGGSFLVGGGGARGMDTQESIQAVQEVKIEGNTGSNTSSTGSRDRK